MNTRIACCIVASTFTMLSLMSCSDSADSATGEPASPPGPASAEPVDDTPKASVHRSHIYLGSLIIQQYHTGEQPVTYGGKELSNVRLYYEQNHNGAVSLQKAEVVLHDGTVKAHVPKKIMSVTFSLNTLRRDPKAVEVEQYFAPYRRR
jgi:hypothetical protein